MRGLALLAALAGQEPTVRAPLEPTHAIELRGVEGRIDHLAMDLGRRRVYVAALGNDSVEVVDLEKGEVVRSLRETREPQGILYLADGDRLVVASGAKGTCDVYDAGSLELVRRVELGDDADNLRLDARRKRVLVAFGRALGIVDVATWTVAHRIPLPAHPEGFQLDATGERAFVNVSGASQIAVVDLGQPRVRATWTIDEAHANFPMVLVPDPEGERVVIGCRSPARLVARRATTGEPTGAAGCSKDPDDLFLDARRERVHAICGEGFVDVFAVKDGSLERTTRVPTAPGARTGLLVPERDELLVAVPHRGAQRAELRVLAVRD